MSILFTIKSGSNSYDVDGPPTDENKWLIVVEEKYRPDKQKFIYEEFIKDYPDIKAIDADQVYALASRSSKLNNWLSKKNLEYAIKEGSPTFYRDYVEPDVYDKASKVIQKLNEVNAKKAAEQAAAASKYQDTLKEIDDKYSRLLSTDNSIAKVLNINTTALPLSIQLAIDNYTPAGSSSPNQKAYARECLVNYKIALLKAIKNDQKIDIEKLIKDQQEK